MLIIFDSNIGLLDVIQILLFLVPYLGNVIVYPTNKTQV
jgi:hypothetical protein